MLAFFLPVKGLERGCDCIFRLDEGLRLDEYAVREEVTGWRKLQETADGSGGASG